VVGVNTRLEGQSKLNSLATFFCDLRRI